MVYLQYVCIYIYIYMYWVVFCGVGQHSSPMDAMGDGIPFLQLVRTIPTFKVS